MANKDETSPRSFLVLDVDGVLNALAREGDRAVWTDWKSGKAHANGRDWPIIWSPTVVETLVRWYDEGLCDVQWLTTWQSNAQRDLSRLLGLPEWPVLGGDCEIPVSRRLPGHLGLLESDYGSDSTDRALRGMWWKADLVLDLLAAEPALPVLWLDDDLCDYAVLQGHLDARYDVLALSPASTTGLTPQLLATAQAWLEQHGPGQPRQLRSDPADAPAPAADGDDRG